jgi:hypothetical protein
LVRTSNPGVLSGTGVQFALWSDFFTANILKRKLKVPVKSKSVLNGKVTRVFNNNKL